jgi:hypothetical protein
VNTTALRYLLTPWIQTALYITSRIFSLKKISINIESFLFCFLVRVCVFYYIYFKILQQTKYKLADNCINFGVSFTYQMIIYGSDIMHKRYFTTSLIVLDKKNSNFYLKCVKKINIYKTAVYCLIFLLSWVSKHDQRSYIPKIKFHLPGATEKHNSIPLCRSIRAAFIFLLASQELSKYADSKQSGTIKICWFKTTR